MRVLSYIPNTYRPDPDAEDPYKDIYEHYKKKYFVSKEQAEAHEKICRSCPKFQEEKCTSQDCGCAQSQARVQPWKFLTQCPELQW